jgi:hypothetical protein
MVYDFVPTKWRIGKINLQPSDVHRKCKNIDLMLNRLTACKMYRICGIGSNDEGMACQLSVAAAAHPPNIHNATEWFTGKMAFCAVKHHSIVAIGLRCLHTNITTRDMGKGKYNRKLAGVS